MGQLTADMIMKLSNFRAEIITALTADLNAGMSVDAVSASGALDLSKVVTELTVSGTKAYTLAAPTATGQKKIVRCVSAASIPLGTLTVSSPDNVTGYVCQTTFLFDTAGQEVEFEATAALKWRAVRVKRAGGSANNVVIGTTLTSAMALWSFFGLSVTGTVSSTTTKSLPNGSAVGERCVLAVTTAATIPSGSIDFVGRTTAGAAVTHFGGLDATTDTAILEWDGQAWQTMYQTGITLT